MIESFRTSDGRRLTYERRGDGPLVVCHPGGPGFSSLYFGELAGLAGDFTLILLNPRGTGGSDRPSSARGYEIEDYVADVDELRHHLGVNALDLLGHSHGGVIAMAYASRYPERVDRLILASTLARFAQEQAAAMEDGMQKRAGEPWYEDARAALEVEQEGSFSTDEELADLAFREFRFYFGTFDDTAAAYLDTLRAEIPNGDALRLFNEEIFGQFDLRPELGAITAKTLVIAGEDDFITGPVCAHEIAAAVAGAREVLLPDTGHFIFLENPTGFRAAVVEHLAS